MNRHEHTLYHITRSLFSSITLTLFTDKTSELITLLCTLDMNDYPDPPSYSISDCMGDRRRWYRDLHLCRGRFPSRVRRAERVSPAFSLIKPEISHCKRSVTNSNGPAYLPHAHARVLPSLAHNHGNKLGLNSPPSRSWHYLSFGLHRNCFRLLFHESSRSRHASPPAGTSAGKTPCAHSRCEFRRLLLGGKV